MRDQRRLARFCRQFEQESFQPLLADARSELAPGIIGVRVLRWNGIDRPHHAIAARPVLSFEVGKQFGRRHLKDAGNFQEIADRTRDEPALDPREKCTDSPTIPARSSSVNDCAERALANDGSNCGKGARPAGAGTTLPKPR